MRLLVLFVVLSGLVSVAMADVDVTGKWSGSFNPVGSEGDKGSTALLVLKQSGAEITGTAGPNEEEQYPIRKGTIEGDKIALEVEHDGHTLKLDLKLDAGRITGEAQMSRDGQSMTAKLDLTRVK